MGGTSIHIAGGHKCSHGRGVSCVEGTSIYMIASLTTTARYVNTMLLLMSLPPHPGESHDPCKWLSSLATIAQRSRESSSGECSSLKDLSIIIIHVV